MGQHSEAGGVRASQAREREFVFPLVYIFEMLERDPSAATASVSASAERWGSGWGSGGDTGLDQQHSR